MKVLTMLVVLMLAGCGPNRIWVKDGTDVQQTEKDIAECQYEAEKYGYVDLYNGGSAISVGYERAMRKNDLVASCLRSRNYHLKVG